LSFIINRGLNGKEFAI